MRVRSAYEVGRKGFNFLKSVSLMKNETNLKLFIAKKRKIIKKISKFNRNLIQSLVSFYLVIILNAIPYFGNDL